MALGFLAVPGPYLAVGGGWDVGEETVSVLMHPDDERAICSLDSEFGRQVAFRMLSFYGAPAPSLGALPPCPTRPSKP
jgi:hypothetical protein